MKGRKLAWAKYLLSFIGWIALCLVLLPVFFVLPYMGCAFSIYGKLMVESYKHKHADQKQAAENDRTMEYLTEELRPFTQPPAGSPHTLQNPQGLGQNG